MCVWCVCDDFKVWVESWQITNKWCIEFASRCESGNIDWISSRLQMATNCSCSHEDLDYTAIFLKFEITCSLTNKWVVWVWEPGFLTRTFPYKFWSHTLRSLPLWEQIWARLLERKGCAENWGTQIQDWQWARPS